MLERVLEVGQSASFVSQNIGASLCDMVVQLVLGWSIYLGRLGVRSPPLPAVGCLFGGVESDFFLVGGMQLNQLYRDSGWSPGFLHSTEQKRVGQFCCISQRLSRLLVLASWCNTPRRIALDSNL